MTKETELVIYDQNKFVEIFTEKTGDSFIEKLEKEVEEFEKTTNLLTYSTMPETLFCNKT